MLWDFNWTAVLWLVVISYYWIDYLSCSLPVIRALFLFRQWLMVVLWLSYVDPLCVKRIFSIITFLIWSCAVRVGCHALPADCVLSLDSALFRFSSLSPISRCARYCYVFYHLASYNLYLHWAVWPLTCEGWRYQNLPVFESVEYKFICKGILIAYSSCWCILSSGSM